ncbi:MAG: type II toxin-antitoxin system RelE/ParE family toxin [Pseudomonadales bacterium]
MRIRWTRKAQRQLDDALEYITEENPIAARQVATRIYKATRLLRENPLLGRPGRVADTREWVVKDTSFLIGYIAENNELQVLALLHSKQHWPDEL